MKKNLIDQSKLNIIIDIFLLLLILPIAGIGFLMKYVLIPGFEKNMLYGNNVDLEFLGQTRHQWGSIHLILSFVFLGLLILHTIFHRKMIVSMFKRLIPSKIVRIGLISLITITSVLFISFPLFVKPEIVEKVPLHRNNLNKNNNISPNILLKNEFNNQEDSISANTSSKIKQENKKHLHSSNDKIEVDGSQTLKYVANKYNVPVDIIASDLKIPRTLGEEKLGRLKKKYPFTMDDVRTSILNYKKRNK